MKVESVKCPSCGGDIIVYPGIKQAYCQYCNSLLVIDDDREHNYAIDMQYDSEDMPLNVELIQTQAEPVIRGALSDYSRFLRVLLGVSFLHNSPIPFHEDDRVEREVFRQNVKKRFFGEIKGKWIQELERPKSMLENVFDEYGVVYTETPSEPEETIESSYDGDNISNVKSIKYTTKIDAKVLPDAIKKTPELYTIVNNSRNNQYIKNMLSAVISSINKITTNKGIVLIVRRDQIELYYFTPTSLCFKFHQYSLEDCLTLNHRIAMLSIVAAEILNKSGDQYALERIKTTIDEDGEEYDEFSCSFKQLVIEKKKYMKW